MSGPIFSKNGQPLPQAILVTPTEPANQDHTERPRRKAASADRQIPWLWIATGGSVFWIVIVLIVAFTNFGQDPGARPVNEKAIAKAGIVEPAFQPVGVPVAVKVVEPAFAELDRKEPAPIDEPAPPAIDPANVVPHLVKQKPAALAEPRDDGDNFGFANCEKIGTNVKFMTEPPEAFKRARVEKKMVFVVHLSGNLEDPGFT
jgi:hypothetical protein